jgi:hypothetical protein
MTTEPSGRALVPDKLHVLMAAMAQRHYKFPGATRFADRVHQQGASTGVHLRSLGWRKAEPHRDLERLLGPQRADHANHRRVATDETVLALQSRMDRTALHPRI